jgi:peptidoglycan-associated lipoprotein
MKNCSYLSLTILALGICIQTTSAQKAVLADAELAFQNKQFSSAAEFYKKAMPKVKRSDSKARCVFMIAECYRLTNNNRMAEMWYSKAIQARYPDPVIHLHRAEALKNEEHFNEAIAEFSTYHALVPSSPAGEMGLKSTEIARKWKDAPSRYKVEDMLQINSADYDFSPMYMGKKKDILVFTSRREGATGGTERDKKTGLLFTDLFSTRVDNIGKWESPRPLTEPVNTAANEGSCWINAKGDKMYFTRCDRNKNKVMRCCVMMCSKIGRDSWTNPVPVNFSIDDYMKFDFRHPALSPDESIMVFQSDIESVVSH